MDYSLPGSSVHGISQARILEWVVISFSRVSSQPWDGTHISYTGRWILYPWITRNTHNSPIPLSPLLNANVLLGVLAQYSFFGEPGWTQHWHSRQVLAPNTWHWSWGAVGEEGERGVEGGGGIQGYTRSQHSRNTLPVEEHPSKSRAVILTLRNHQKCILTHRLLVPVSGLSDSTGLGWDWELAFLTHPRQCCCCWS